MTPLDLSKRARELAYEHLKEWIDAGTIFHDEVERTEEAFHAAMLEARNAAIDEAATKCMQLREERGVGLDASFFASQIINLKSTVGGGE